jgi:hypothetical protein
MKRGGGIKGLDDKSSGMEILMSEAFRQNQPHRISHRIQIDMFRPIRVDHTNCLQVSIKTHSTSTLGRSRGVPEEGALWQIDHTTTIDERGHYGHNHIRTWNRMQAYAGLVVAPDVRPSGGVGLTSDDWRLTSTSRQTWRQAIFFLLSE